MEGLVLAQEEAVGAGVALVIGVVYLAFIILFIASAWRIFTKAGEPGWKVLIPIYNYYVFLRIVGRPGWWLLLFFIPFVNFVIGILVAIDAAKSFGKDTAFALGLIFLSPIFYPILAFGDARYLGPAGPEPRPGYPNVGQGGYGAPQYYGAPQGGYQPPPGQSWGQPPGQQPGQQWGQPPAPQQSGWGDGSGGWGQQPQPQQPQPQHWGQPPSGSGSGSGAGSGSVSGQDYPPPPVG